MVSVLSVGFAWALCGQGLPATWLSPRGGWEHGGLARADGPPGCPPSPTLRAPAYRSPGLSPATASPKVR